MLGGAALHVLPVTQLSWVGASFALLALLLLFLSFRASATRPGGRDARISATGRTHERSRCERVEL